MKYPVILKYTFSYICSGNFYKPATSEYYQLFTNLNDSRMVSIQTAVYEKVKSGCYRRPYLIENYRKCKPY